MLNRTKPWAFLLLAVSVSLASGCFSNDDDDDDNVGGEMQNSSLTQLALTQCNRTPEDEEPTTVLGLAFEGDPDSETADPDGSNFSNNCI